MTGADVAEALAQQLREPQPHETPMALVRRLSEHVATVKRAAGLAPGEGGAATLAVLRLVERDVVRVGDPWVRIGGSLDAAARTSETVVAAARALLLAEAIRAGAPVAELERDDVARTAVQPLLRAAAAFRNDACSPYAFGAVDGAPVPGRFVEVWPLPEGPIEVTLATDGYPSLGVDLEQTERALADRLTRDPLMQQHPPATKGRDGSGGSYDDRTFVRVLVEEA